MSELTYDIHDLFRKPGILNPLEATLARYHVGGKKVAVSKHKCNTFDFLKSVRKKNK